MQRGVVLLLALFASSVASIAMPICGDGKVEGQETCDIGNPEGANDIDLYACVNCKLVSGFVCRYQPSATRQTCEAKCGDGILRYDGGWEACDDGNRLDGDGCDGDCAIEYGWACPAIEGVTSVCTTICGDNVVTYPEECDSTQPGCVACRTAKGYVCDSEANDCAPLCGDGVTIAPEECDDGNLNVFDQCGDVNNGPCAVPTRGEYNPYHFWQCPAVPESPPRGTLPTYSPSECTCPYYYEPGLIVTMCGSGTEADPNTCTTLGSATNCAFCGHACPLVVDGCGPYSGSVATYTDRACWWSGTTNWWYCGCNPAIPNPPYPPTS